MVNATFVPEKAPEGYVEETYALGFRPGNFKANREDVLEFPIASLQLSAKYKNLQMPTIILFGLDDPFGTTQQAERLHGILPNSKFVKLPNLGHMIPTLHPKVVMDAVYDLKTF